MSIRPHYSRLVNDLAQRLIANTPEPEQFLYVVMVEFIYQQNIRAVLRADSDLPGPVPTPEEETDGSAWQDQRLAAANQRHAPPHGNVPACRVVP